MIRRILLMAAVATVMVAATPAVDQARKMVTEKKYDEAYKLLEEAKPRPAAAAQKKEFAGAYLAVGDGFMYDESLPPRMKYPAALRAYRRVLELDKENQKAKTGISTIEGIYKSMGRPVPQ